MAPGDDGDDGRLPTSRRTFLKTTGAAAAAGAVAGCGNVADQQFAAEPAGLPEPAGHGYESATARTLTATRGVSVADSSMTVTIENELRTYRPRDGGAPWFGTLTTPSAQYFGKSLNPLADASFVTLLDEHAGPLLAATEATETDQVTWATGPTAVSEFDGRLFGDRVAGTTLLGRVEVGPAVLVHLVRETHREDVVFAAAVRAYEVPGDAPEEAEGLLGSGEVPGRDGLRAQQTALTDVLPAVEHPVGGAGGTTTAADDGRAILTDVHREEVGGGYERITATVEQFDEESREFVDKRVTLDDPTFWRRYGSRAPDLGDPPGTLVDLPPPSEGDRTNSRLGGRIADAIAALVPVTPAEAATGGGASVLPEQASLKHRQTRLKQQGQRGTCTTFAVCAALEAAYGATETGSIDLSEQLFAHMNKMVLLNNESGPGAYSSQRDPKTGTLTHDGIENFLGTGGGMSIRTALAFASRYGVPEEKHADVREFSYDNQYIPDRDYEKTNQTGDRPRYHWTNPGSITQAVANEFTLQDEFEDYHISPGQGHASLRPFPREALWNARYGVESYVMLDGTTRPDVLKDPRWYQKVLALGGREVIVGYDTGPTKTAAPKPERGDYDGADYYEAVTEWRESDGDATAYDSTGSSDVGHAVTLVGYDAKSDHPHFVAKNSWDEYTKLSFDLFTNGVVDEAGVITGVRDPTFDSLAAQDFLGRYDLTYGDGSGTLDVFRLPDWYDPTDLPAKGKNTTATADRRVGSFTDENGEVYRVNGEFVWQLGSFGPLTDPVLELHFNVDFDTPNQPFDSTAGTTFVGYMDYDDRTYMAGSVTGPRDASDTGFFATKDDWPAATSPRSSKLSLTGEWLVTSPVLPDDVRFSITDQNLPAGTFTGWVHERGPFDRSDYGDAITGSLAPGTGRVSAAFDDVNGLLDDVDGTFEGWLLDDTGAHISGTYDTASGTAPMVLTRTGDVKSFVDITSPADNQTVDAGKSITLEAFVVGPQGVTVHWQAVDQQQNGIELGTGDRISVALGPGNYGIFADATAGNGFTHIALVVEDGSTSDVRARVFAPGEGTTITSRNGTANGTPYADVSVSGMAKSGPGSRLSGTSLQWSYRRQGSSGAWTDAGTGERATIRLPDVQSGATTYEVRLAGTSATGDTGTDTVTVRVDL